MSNTRSSIFTGVKRSCILLRRYSCPFFLGMLHDGSLKASKFTKAVVRFFLSLYLFRKSLFVSPLMVHWDVMVEPFAEVVIHK